MLSLTTWQRDMLHHLIQTGESVEIGLLGRQFNLSLRQIRYGLHDIESWLERRQVTIVHLQRANKIQLVLTPTQRERLLAELVSQDKIQLILTSEQRQQLLALVLLSTHEPLILQQLQEDFLVSRSTILKDLDTIEPWINKFNLDITRRQHRGCWIQGSEFAQRQALVALLWGDASFIQQALVQIEPTPEINFALAQDIQLVPIIARVNAALNKWDISKAHAVIIKIEEQLGIWFTVEALTLISASLALQMQRVEAKQLVTWQPVALQWVQEQVVWPVITEVGTQLWSQLSATEQTAETVALALQFLASAKDVPWSYKFEIDPIFHDLIMQLITTIANAYNLPKILEDKILYDGFEVLILPAYVRQRFSMWTPQTTLKDANLELYSTERGVVSQIADEVFASIGVSLSSALLDELILLLRAAVIRSEPKHNQHVLVVCPSGMVTTQLLIAQLKARFLSIGTFEVLSIRELSAERLAVANLLITTVPLSFQDQLPIEVVQVHPLLKAEDIALLSQRLT
jgi:mannitol operon transcriptional antiterminator